MDEKIKNVKSSKIVEQELNKPGLKPSWMSRNEGVHERVNFDDTLWGFELAGGSYYNTPLRVTRVKHDSRAMHAGIRVGDVLQSINNVPTNTLTVQEAHDIVLESGIEIKLNFYASDVLETMHYVYQDQYEEEQAELRRQRELEESVKDLTYKGAKSNKVWSILWPCNKKRDVMYKESNCFLVPSVYENKHPERLLKNETTEIK